MKNILTESKKTKYEILEFLPRIDKNDFKEEEIDVLVKSLNKTFYLSLFSSSKTLHPNDSEKDILIFQFSLSKENKLKQILKILYSIKGLKSRHLFFIFKVKLDGFYFSFNNFLLNDEITKKIFKSRHYISDKLVDFEDLEKIFSFNKSDLISIKQIYSDICKKFLYFIENGVLPSLNIDWKYFDQVSSLNKLNKSRKSLLSKFEKSFIPRERIELNNKIKEIDNEIKMIKEKLNNY